MYSIHFSYPNADFVNDVLSTGKSEFNTNRSKLIFNKEGAKIEATDLTASRSAFSSLTRHIKIIENTLNTLKNNNLE